MILAIYAGSAAGKTYLLESLFEDNKLGCLTYLPEITSSSQGVNEYLDTHNNVVTDVNANCGFSTKYFRDRDVRCVVLKVDEDTVRRNLKHRREVDPSKGRDYVAKHTIHTQNKLMKKGWEAYTPEELKQEVLRMSVDGIDIGTKPTYQPARAKSKQLGKVAVLELVYDSESMSVDEMATKYGITQMSVRRILKGGRWGRVTGITNTWRIRKGILTNE